MLQLPNIYILKGDDIQMLGYGCSACETHSADGMGIAVLGSSCDCKESVCYQAANEAWSEVYITQLVMP